MNFLISSTRLVMLDCDTISVTTQNWISLKRLMNTSKLAVICVLNSIKWQKFVNNKCKLILWYGYNWSFDVLKSKPNSMHTRASERARIPINVLEASTMPACVPDSVYVAVTYTMRHHLSTATHNLCMCICMYDSLAYALSHTRTTIICCVLSPLVELLYTELSHNDCCFS